MRPLYSSLLSPVPGVLLLAGSLALCTPPQVLDAQPALGKPQPLTLERARMHDNEQWREIERHLPDPNTATPQILELQGDVLRARRFPDDALDYYRYALARGGNAADLTNKMGLTQLEMKNYRFAELSFRAAVKLNKKNAEAWNNLGASQFIQGSPSSSISNYKRAIKLNKHSAVYHANLATAYFQTQNFGGARKELAEAMKLDPNIFNRKDGSGGMEAHVLSSDERARFSYEMAKLYAQKGLEEQMLHSLAMAGEAGMDLPHELRKDAVLGKYLTDPRVVLLIQNAELIRKGHAGAIGTTAGSVQPLKPS